MKQLTDEQVQQLNILAALLSGCGNGIHTESVVRDAEEFAGGNRMTRYLLILTALFGSGLAAIYAFLIWLIPVITRVLQ